MKTQSSNTVTTSKSNVYFSSFKTSKRVLWSAHRNYSY